MHCESGASSSVVPYFPYLQTGQLTKDETLILTEQLYEDARNIRFKFAGFMTDLKRDLDRRTTKDELVLYFVNYNKKFKPILQDCTSIAKVLIEVSDYVSFFDYDVLENLTAQFCSDSIKQKFEEYKESFEAFAKRRVKECPSDIFGDQEDSEKVGAVIADKTIEDLTVEELKRLEFKLKKILGIKLIKILCVKGGSVTIIFRVLDDSWLSNITEEQKEALWKEGVTSISYGDHTVHLSGSKSTNNKCTTHCVCQGVLTVQLYSVILHEGYYHVNGLVHEGKLSHFRGCCCIGRN